MSELVKGITIPDGTYREYAPGAGPTVLVNGYDHGMLDSGQATEVILPGLRLESDLKIVFQVGETPVIADPVTATQNGRQVTCTVDTSQFDPEVEGTITIYIDSEPQTLWGEQTFQVKAPA